MRLLIKMVIAASLITACGDKSKNDSAAEEPKPETGEKLNPAEESEITVQPNSSLSNDNIATPILELLNQINRDDLGDLLYGLDDRVHIPMNAEYASNLIIELDKHGCTIDLNVNEHQCQIPSTLQELDHLWESAVHLELLGYNHRSLSSQQAVHASVIGEDIQKLVEGEKTFARYRAENKKIRKFLEDAYGLEIGQVISIGGIKQRLSLLTLTELFFEEDFASYLAKHSIEEILSYETDLFFIEDGFGDISLLMGYRLSKDDVLDLVKNFSEE